MFKHKTAAVLAFLLACALIATPAEAKRRDSCVWFGVTLCG